MAKPSEKIRSVRAKIQKRKAKKRAKKRERKAKLSRAKTRAKLKTAPARFEGAETKRQLKGLADDTGVSKVTSKASSLVSSAADQFDGVGGADVDGDNVLERNEVAFGLDLNNDGMIGSDEVFTQDLPEPPRNSEMPDGGAQQPRQQPQDPSRVAGLDRFLVDSGPPETDEQSVETSRNLDDFLI